VARVVDGDTVALAGGERIRLYGIDAPEKEQARGAEATQALESLVSVAPGSTVLLRRYGMDGYGRTLGGLTLEGREGEDYLNHEMIRRGWAWAYSKPHDRVKPPRAYINDQLAARLEHRGLWQDLFPQNPADFRAERRNRSAAAPKPARKRRRHRAKKPDRSGSDSE